MEGSSAFVAAFLLHFSYVCLDDVTRARVGTFLRYFMELPNDAIAYAIVVGVLTLLRVQQRLQWEQVHAATLARDASFRTN